VLYAEYTGSNVDLSTRSTGVGVTVKAQSAGTRLTAVSPGTAGQPPLAAQLASAGLELNMLARQEQLILGIMPTNVPVF
jgi:hypothetical protein